MRFSQIVVNRQSLFYRGFRFRILFARIAAAFQSHRRVRVRQSCIGKRVIRVEPDGLLKVFNRFFDIRAVSFVRQSRALQI